MEHKFEQLKKYKDITLDHEERSILRAHMAHVVSSPIELPESWFHRGAQYGLRMALSAFVFVVFIGGSLSAIADGALPGDPLYSFKVNVNEEVKGAFLSTPEEKVAYQKGRVETRVNEIQTLAESKSLTPAKQAKAQKALDGNISALSKELTLLSDKSTSSALSVTANLEETLQVNKTAITTAVSGTASSEATLKLVDGTLKKVSDQEVKILSKEIDNIASSVTTTPTTTTTTISTTPTPPPATTPVAP